MVAAAPSRKRTRKASAVKPLAIGPTWQRNSRGKFVLPRRTLGWQILEWCTDNLLQPDGDRAGLPWVFTDEQARFLLWWYEIDAHGAFVNRGGVLRRLKGWGKDPFGAVLCAIEFVGPCRFSHWDGAEPVAKPHPAAWVQTAAVSKDQTRNTMTLFPGLFSKRCIREHAIDMGKEIIYAYAGARRIEAVTSSPRSLEGGRSTFVLMNETHHWIASNDGQAMAEVIDRNLAKSRDGAARSLQITNAHSPGEESVAELAYDTYEEILTGRSRARGFLYDSLEAPPETVMADETSLRAGLMAARGDSTWLNIDRLVETIYDPRTKPGISRRFYLNQVVAEEDAWLSPQEWDVIGAPGYQVREKSLITLGFDGSKSGDWTALVACEVETQHIWPLGIWNPADERDNGGEIDRIKVDAAVAAAFQKYDVVGFYSDVHPWESYIDAWAEKYGETLCVKSSYKHPIGYDMRGRTDDDEQGGGGQKAVTKAVEAFHDAILGRTLTHDGNPTLRQHALNARNRVNSYGTTFGKERRNSEKKIDALAAAMLARQCRMDYLALPENKKREQHKDWLVL